MMNYSSFICRDNSNFICSPIKFVLTRKNGYDRQRNKVKRIYTSNKIIKVMQKDYLSTSLSSTSLTKGQTVLSNSFALISEKYPLCPDLKIIPWDGKLGDIEFTNTCPMDNFLFIFHALSLINKRLIDEMPFPLYNKLTEVNNLIYTNRFSEAEYTWLQYLPNSPAEINGQIDVCGNEFDSFVESLTPMLQTSFNSTCSNQMCPKPYLTFKSKSIELPVVGQHTQKNSKQIFWIV